MSIRRLLITPRDFVGLKEFDQNTRPDKINPHILSAQREDITPLIKERLYNAIIKDPDAYESLLNEGYYTYKGIEYVNYGLKSIIALFAHARFTMYADASYNPNGINTKRVGESEPISDAKRRMLYQKAQEEALDYWGNVRNFLIRTKEPLFEDICINSGEQSSGGFSFNIITR